ncbi:MAG: tRNA (adenosine(37)-N6)-dimethylallyltransferase MiaA [Christensenella sp.]|nr:tRNA (adenosine(37)-N6)-dimethylallyltransferase MiaA [Christensenella sp.]
MKDKVYIIVGPTASGKTAAAVALAKQINGEIISADSMQIYQGMDIGTAKPSMEEREGIPHHMFDVASPGETYSVAMFQSAAQECIADILKRGNVPIIAGGTGLYINSLTYCLDFTNTSYDEAFRAELQQYDNELLHQMLLKQDAEAATRIHVNDKKRMIRRLEILRNGETGEYRFNEINDQHNFVMAGLSPERAVLYARINKRVDQMMQDGLLDEVKKLAQFYPHAPTALQAIGYKELLDAMKGKISFIQAVEEIKKNTRHYAKRQLTWFRRDPRITWYDPLTYQNMDELAAEIINQGKSREG